MEKKEFDSVHTFDTQYTNQQIQFMKILLPYLEPNLRKTITVLIRFMELQYTISHVQSHPDYYAKSALPFSLDDNMDQIRKYCHPQFASMIENLISIRNAMKMYEEMKGMMELFGNGETSEDSVPFDILSDMMDPQQMELFRMFQAGASESES